MMPLLLPGMRQSCILMPGVSTPLIVGRDSCPGNLPTRGVRATSLAHKCWGNFAHTQSLRHSLWVETHVRAICPREVLGQRRPRTSVRATSPTHRCLCDVHTHHESHATTQYAMWTLRSEVTLACLQASGAPCHLCGSCSFALSHSFPGEPPKYW